MALLEIITIGIVGGILHKSRKEEQKKKAEEEFRKSFQCQFADDMSEMTKKKIELLRRVNFLMIYLNVNLG